MLGINDDTDPRSIQQRVDVTNYLLRTLASLLLVVIGLLIVIAWRI